MNLTGSDKEIRYTKDTMYTSLRNWWRETDREGGADGDGIDTADVSLEYCGKCII